MRQSVLVLLVVCVVAIGAGASSGRAVAIEDRAKGADAVVVGHIIQVAATLERNAFGDQVIVSHTFVQVEDTLKGNPPVVLPLDVEGGTVAGLTLRVSDLPSVNTGDRAVFFVTRTQSGAHIPYLRGNGIVKLDSTDHVQGSGVTLAEVKRLIRQGLQ